MTMSVCEYVSSNYQDVIFVGKSPDDKGDHSNVAINGIVNN